MISRSSVVIYDVGEYIVDVASLVSEVVSEDTSEYNPTLRVNDSEGMRAVGGGSVGGSGTVYSIQ